jgi:hypothetical protein
MAEEQKKEATYNDIQSMVMNTLKEIAEQLQNATVLTVSTKVWMIDPANPTKSVELEAAKTTMKLDGDRDQWIPVLKTENNNLMVLQSIADLHNKALDDSIAYREKASTLLLDFLRTGKLPE